MEQRLVFSMLFTIYHQVVKRLHFYIAENRTLTARITLTLTRI